MVMEVVHEDMGEGNLQCSSHPYKNSSPGGICALCLQEKLGKLVSSSFPVAVFPSSSSSPSPSFRSDFNGSTTTACHVASSSANPQTQSQSNESCNINNGHYTRRSRILPFVKKKKKDVISSDATSIVFKRSKSIATPRRGMHFLDENYIGHNRRGFWSFLYSSKNPTSKKSEKSLKDVNFTPTTPSTVCSSSVGGVIRSKEKKREDFVVVDENGSPNEAAFDRKVSRSRSVGCGSRSFSGDFFGRISTGFGDCTLRRVESQREGKSKVQPSMHSNGGNSERVKCGGIFSGFMITSSSSSSSSSNSYWVSSSTEENNNNNKNNTSNGNLNVNGKSICASSSVRHVSHGRSKSWGWALASPMRAFSKPSSMKRDHHNSAGSNKNVTPNLTAIPSLLSVGG